MKFKAIKDINNRITEITTEQQKSLANLNNTILAEQAKQAEAEQASNDAVNNEDMEAFTRAKASFAESAAKIEFCERRISAINENGTATDAECEEVLEFAKSIHKAAADKAKADVAKHMTAIFAALDEYNASKDEINNTLNRWREKVREFGSNGVSSGYTANDPVLMGYGRNLAQYRSDFKK